MVLSVRVHFFWISDKFRGLIHARARSLGGHLRDPFNGLDSESGLTVHGAGLFLAGQVVARFARDTLGGVSVVESLADDSPSGGPRGARKLPLGNAPTSFLAPSDSDANPRTPTDRESVGANAAEQARTPAPGTTELRTLQDLTTAHGTVLCLPPAEPELCSGPVAI